MAGGVVAVLSEVVLDERSITTHTATKHHSPGTQQKGSWGAAFTDGHVSCSQRERAFQGSISCLC